MSNDIVLRSEAKIDQTDNVFTNAIHLNERLVQGITVKNTTYFFINLKNENGVVIEWEGLPHEAFDVFFFNKLTCPVNCYHKRITDDNGNLIENPVVNVGELDVSIVSKDKIRPGLEAIEKSVNSGKFDEDAMIPQKDILDSLEKQTANIVSVRSSTLLPPKAYQVCQHQLGIQKKCDDVTKTPLRSISNLDYIFTEVDESGEYIAKREYTEITDDNVEKVKEAIRELVKSYGEAIEAKNFDLSLTHGSIMQNLMAMTLLMRDVCPVPWQWYSSLRKDPKDYEIDNLTVAQIFVLQRCCNESGQFFIPETEEEIDTMIEDMKRVYAIMTKRLNPSIVVLKHVVDVTSKKEVQYSTCVKVLSTRNPGTNLMDID